MPIIVIKCFALRFVINVINISDFFSAKMSENEFFNFNQYKLLAMNQARYGKKLPIILTGIFGERKTL